MMAHGTVGSSPAPVVVPPRKSPYERLKHDLERDSRVAQELAQGKRVGFYKLKGQLGSGNFSRVKLAYHLLSNEKVAIKIIDKTKLDERARRLLSREITCMEHLDHSNVIRLFEVIETFPRLHIVMECASGGDLHAKVVNDGPFTEGSGRSIFIQVVSAINHMHKNGVIHRDLKAENVFFVSPLQIKVGDFGFSTTNTGDPLDTFCGSPPYAAPELFRDESYSGRMVDIWALGVLLYFMLTGNMPFRGETVPLLKRVIVEGKYHMPTNLTPACQDVIAGLLMKDTEERFTMETLCDSFWLRGGSHTNMIPNSFSNSGIDSFSSDLAVSFKTGDTGNMVDQEVAEMLKELGVPSSEMDQVVGEPRNPIAGAYRILLHRKHTASLMTHSIVNERRQNSLVMGGTRKRSVGCANTTRPAKTGEHQRSKLCIIF